MCLGRSAYDVGRKWPIADDLRSNAAPFAGLSQPLLAGMASGEFSSGDAKLTARLVNTACVRFRDPRLIVEHKEEPEPTLDQMINFCIAAISKQPV
jgi:hypothetical protein